MKKKKKIVLLVPFGLAVMVFLRAAFDDIGLTSVRQFNAPWAADLGEVPPELEQLFIVFLRYIGFLMVVITSVIITMMAEVYRDGGRDVAWPLRLVTIGTLTALLSTIVALDQSDTRLIPISIVFVLVLIVSPFFRKLSEE